MKQLGSYKGIGSMIKKYFGVFIIVLALTLPTIVSYGFSDLVFAQSNAKSTCEDGIDNDKDGKADFAGAYIDGKFYEPDPTCYKRSSSELGDSVNSNGLVPCVNKCTFTDIFKLINNVLRFMLTTIFIPVFVIVLMYTGYQYLMAQGKPGMHAKLKNRLWKLVVGFVIVLCAWLIVRTFLSIIGYEEGALFLE